MLVRFKKFTKIFGRENHSLAPILLVFIATSLILCPQGTNAFSLLKILGIGDSDKGEDLKISTEADDTSDTFSESPFSFSFDSNSIDDEGSTKRFSLDAWKKNVDILAAIKELPLLQDLSKGSLEQLKYRFWMLQTAHLAAAFTKAMAFGLVKANGPVELQFFENCANFSHHYQALVANYSRLMNNTEGTTALTELPSPTTQHFASFLVSTAGTKTLGTILASIMPYHWYQAKIREWLSTMPTYDNNPYRQWIDQMGAPFPLEQSITLLEQLSAGQSDAELAEMHEVFRFSAKLHWMFLDAVYGEEFWRI